MVHAESGSKTHAISTMEFFVAIVQCPVSDYSTKIFILGDAWILHPCIVHVQLTL